MFFLTLAVGNGCRSVALLLAPVSMINAIALFINAADSLGVVLTAVSGLLLLPAALLGFTALIFAGFGADTVVPDFKSTGIKDGKRTWAWPVVIRAVNSIDATSATVERIPYELLEHIADRIVAEVAGVNRVLYDLSKKPVATIGT